MWAFVGGLYAKSSVSQSVLVAGGPPQRDSVEGSVAVRLMPCVVEFGFVIAVMGTIVQVVLNWW